MRLAYGLSGVQTFSAIKHLKKMMDTKINQNSDIYQNQATPRIKSTVISLITQAAAPNIANLSRKYLRTK